MTARTTLVAGAGAAGLAAALAAAQGGNEVVLLERSRHFQSGSNTSMSTAMIPAGGSRWQREVGVIDSPENFADDIRAATEWSASEEIARALTSVAPEMVAWLADECGLPLALVTDFRYPGHSANRCHTVPDRSGKTMLKLLIDATHRDERITFLCPFELAAVKQDNGLLHAVMKSPDGAEESEEFDSIILATNGFGANPELVARHIPSMVDAYYHGGDGSQGDALAIGDALGADTAFLDAFQGHGSLAMPHAILLTWAVMMHGGVMVNAHGERFADESASYSAFGAKVAAQQDGVGWVIFDERIGALCESFADYQDILSAKAIHRLDDVGSLASLIGCPATTLSASLRETSETRAAGTADRFGRRDFGGGIAEGPLLAVRVSGALFHTQGGLLVDGSARVLRDGVAIPGLYAAGGAAAGVSGTGSSGYLAGNGLLAALGLGYLAGRHASSEN